MATGYKDSTGNDLNTIFATGSGGALTGYKDLAGNDLNTRFAPYTTGAIGTLTGYKDLAGNDLNARFAPLPPPPNFPTQQTSGVTLSNYVCVDMDGVNCVVSGHGGSYLYWSNNSCETLNKATINGNANQTFFGCVAISGANAIAMGRLTSNGTNTFFLSSDFGKTYTMTTTSGQTTATGTFSRGYINISGANAVWGESETNYVHYSINYGSTWTRSAWPTSAATVFVNGISMYGNNVYVSTATTGFWYSTNGGQSFTKNNNYTPSGANSVTQVGTNIYVGAQNIIYKFTSPTANPTIAYNLGSAGTFFVAMSGCNTSSNGDFIIMGTDQINNRYSNNGTALQNFTRVGGNVYKIVANNSRIVYGGSSTLYWGKNNFIT